jgi:hypothetical protein
VFGGRQIGFQTQNNNRNPVAEQAQGSKNSARMQNEPETTGFSAACKAPSNFQALAVRLKLFAVTVSI